MTTHIFRRGYGQISVEHQFQQISSVSKYTFMKTKKCTFPLQFHPLFPMSLREPQGEEQWKEADTYTETTGSWLRDVTYHSLDTYQN